MQGWWSLITTSSLLFHYLYQNDLWLMCLWDVFWMLFSLSMKVRTPCPSKWGHPVLSTAFSHSIYTCSIPFEVSLQNYSIFLPIRLSFEHWLECDWSAFNSQLLLRQVGVPNLYIAIALASGRGRIYPFPIHLISQTHDLYRSGKKLAGLEQASALAWMHSPAYNAMGAGWWWMQAANKLCRKWGRQEEFPPFFSSLE